MTGEQLTKALRQFLKVARSLQWSDQTVSKDKLKLLIASAILQWAKQTTSKASWTQTKNKSDMANYN